MKHFCVRHSLVVHLGLLLAPFASGQVSGLTLTLTGNQTGHYPIQNIHVKVEIKNVSHQPITTSQIMADGKLSFQFEAAVKRESKSNGTSAQNPKRPPMIIERHFPRTGSVILLR